MTDSRKQAMAILARVAEFLDTLPEDQLDDLQSGAARLTLIPAGADQPLTIRPRPRTTVRAKREHVPTPEIAQIAETLRTIDSRELAIALLKPLRKDPDLRDVASILNITVAGSLSKDRFISAIVEATVGNRLDSLAIRGTATLPY